MSTRARILAVATILTVTVGLVASPASASSKGPSPITKVTTSQSAYAARTVRDANTGATSARVTASKFCVKAKTDGDWYGSVTVVTYAGKSVKSSKFRGAAIMDASFGETAKVCYYVGKTTSDVKKLRALGYQGLTRKSYVTFQVVVSGEVGYKDFQKVIVKRMK